MLLFFIVGIFIAPRVYFYFKKPEIVQDIAFENWVKEINLKEDSIKAFESLTNKNKYSKKKVVIKYFEFNPNTVSFNEMKTLGFNSRTASILIKFREKGAKFYSKKDLLNIYGFGAFNNASSNCS